MPAHVLSLLLAALLAAIPAVGNARNPGSTAPFPAGQEAPAPAGEPAKVAEAAPATRQVEGTKLLFLRLNLRIKLIEHNFVDLTPEQLKEHLLVASTLIDQLRTRPLADDEASRTERAAQYLQNLVDTYVTLYRG